MLRVVLFLLGVSALAFGLSWLADRPGSLVIDWQGYVIETSVFHSIVMLSLLLGLTILSWSILRSIWQSPAAVGNFFNRRREQRGLEALSSGMIAIGAGDKSLATKYAVQARKALPNEPLTHLLRAQAAQLAGDRTTSRRIFEAMLAAPDTEQLGLRGLFLEAEREGEGEAARQFAQRAVKLNPKLTWPVQSLFDIQCREGDWSGALETLAIARKNGHIERQTADRRRAVLLTALAQKAETTNPDQSIALALEAHQLAQDLVPAAAIAGRMLASRGNTPKAAKVLQKAWRKNPHPDLAMAYAYARLGDSPRDRLDRVKQLAAISPHSIESSIAVAQAAIEAKAFDDARSALEPLADGRLTQRVCTLMARIEGEQHGDKGRVREWLARAVNAPRDPVWTADGIVADAWAPVSPVTGALDAFQWRVAVEDAEKGDSALMAEKIEELVKLGARTDAMIATDQDGAAPRAGMPGHASAPVSSPAAARGPVTEAEIVDVAPIAASPAAASTPAAQSVPAQGNAVPKDQPQGKAPVTNSAPPVASPPKATAPSPASSIEQAEAASTAARMSTGSLSSVSPSGGVTVPTAGSTVGKSPAATDTSPASHVASMTSAGDRSASRQSPKIYVSPHAPDDPGPDTASGSAGVQSGAAFRPAMKA